MIFGNKQTLMELIVKEDWLAAIQRVDNYPREAQKWSQIGFDGVHNTQFLPLHQACSSNAPKELIIHLLEAYPKAAKTRDSYYRRLPVHYACLKHEPEEVIRALDSQYPKGPMEPDLMGRIPLHYAIFEEETAVIEALIVEFPRGATIQDKNGWLPLHVAARMGSPIHIIKKLIEIYPASINVLTKKERMTPFDCFLKFGRKFDSEMSNILRRRPQRSPLEGLSRSKTW